MILPRLPLKSKANHLKKFAVGSTSSTILHQMKKKLFAPKTNGQKTRKELSPFHSHPNIPLLEKIAGSLFGRVPAFLRALPLYYWRPAEPYGFGNMFKS